MEILTWCSSFLLWLLSTFSPSDGQSCWDFWSTISALLIFQALLPRSSSVMSPMHTPFLSFISFLTAIFFFCADIRAIRDLSHLLHDGPFVTFGTHTRPPYFPDRISSICWQLTSTMTLFTSSCLTLLSVLTHLNVKSQWEWNWKWKPWYAAALHLNRTLVHHCSSPLLKTTVPQRKSPLNKVQTWMNNNKVKRCLTTS